MSWAKLKPKLEKRSLKFDLTFLLMTYDVCIDETCIKDWPLHLQKLNFKFAESISFQALSKKVQIISTGENGTRDLAWFLKRPSRRLFEISLALFDKLHGKKMVKLSYVLLNISSSCQIWIEESRKTQNTSCLDWCVTTSFPPLPHRTTPFTLREQKVVNLGLQ